jgi:hypothetical protein
LSEEEIKWRQRSKGKEIKWRQRSKGKDLLEGDRNTKYFMLKASGRKRRNNNFRLIQEEGLISGDNEILKYATIIYTRLFCAVNLMPLTMSENLPECLMKTRGN